MGCRAPPYLLHVTQHVLPAVKHPFAFFRIQLVDEVGGVVFTAALVSETRKALGSGLRGRVSLPALTDWPTFA